MKSKFADLMTRKFNSRGYPFSWIFCQWHWWHWWHQKNVWVSNFFHLHFAGDTGDTDDIKIWRFTKKNQVKSKFDDLMTIQFNSRGYSFFWIFLLGTLVTDDIWKIYRCPIVFISETKVCWQVGLVLGVPLFLIFFAGDTGDTPYQNWDLHFFSRLHLEL